MLPRIFFTADGSPLDLADWSFGSAADLGYDQLRGVMASSRASRIAGGLDQGSLVQAWTEHGTLVYEGKLPSPPKITQEHLAQIAAQGHAYEASKVGNRITPILTAPGAWLAANAPPLNWGVTVSGLTVSSVNSLAERSFTVDHAGTGGDRWAVAMPAKGMLLSRLRFERNQALAASDVIRVYTADYPDIARTARIQAQIDSTPIGSVHEVVFAVPGEVVVIEMFDTGIGSPASASSFVNPVVWGDYALDAIYSQHAAWTVARQLGWDAVGVTGRGCAPHPSLDWTGDAAGFLSYVAGLEDFCWGAWGDTGAGPLLTFDRYGGVDGRRTWDVSAATGARWDLDPLERIRRVVVQLFNIDNSLNEVTLEAPETGLPEGVETELKGSLTDAQDDIGLALASGWRLLERFLSQRYRGRVSFSHAFEKDSGRDAVFEVRAGDLIRISDFAMDGSITLRVHDVAFSPGGAVVGVEASAFPLGGAIGGAPSVSAGIGLGPQLSSSTGGTATYIPGGSAYSPYANGIPTTGGGFKPPKPPLTP